jgi:hypothetical protein
VNPTGDVRDLTERMVAIVRSEDVDQLAALVSQIVDPRGPRSDLFTPVLAQLVRCLADTLRRRAATDPADDAERVSDDPAVFTAELVDTLDDEVAIDELDPALRAVLRAVLAELNGDTESARFQLAFVDADREPLARLDALWHALLWTSMLDDDSSWSATTP